MVSTTIFLYPLDSDTVWLLLNFHDVNVAWVKRSLVSIQAWNYLHIEATSHCLEYLYYFTENEAALN